VFGSESIEDGIHNHQRTPPRCAVGEFLQAGVPLLVLPLCLNLKLRRTLLIWLVELTLAWRPLAFAVLSMPPLKTYIIEDHPLIRESLIATMEELGPVKVVGYADDERTAIDWLRRSENEADLVVVDIFLRAGSGLGVLRSATGFARRRSMVVLSNYVTDEVRRKCLLLGAARVFDKSNDIEELMAYCKDLVARESGSIGTSKWV
jgi:CheY-like chemotaxis protein